MLYAIATDAERLELQREMNQTTDKKWYRRLKIIDLSRQRYRVGELASMFDLSCQTIRSYIHTYNEGQLAALSPAYGAGRRCCLDWSQEQWLDLLQQPPVNHAKLNSGALNWTQALLQQYLYQYHQLKVSQSTLSKALKRAKVHWRRAKLTVRSPDPLYLVKRQRVEQLKEKARNGTLSAADAEQPPPNADKLKARLVYFDSTDLHWCPDVGSTYQPASQQVKVRSPGDKNPWYALFGSLCFPSGEGLYTIHQHKRHLEVECHLQSLLTLDSDVFWFVVLDNASAHTTAQLDNFIATHRQRLELVFLPTYSPHLNLIERLWRFMRSQVTRNQFYVSLSAEAEAVVNWLSQLPFSSFCRLIGLDESELHFL